MERVEEEENETSKKKRRMVIESLWKFDDRCDYSRSFIKMLCCTQHSRATQRTHDRGLVSGERNMRPPNERGRRSLNRRDIRARTSQLLTYLFGVLLLRWFPLPLLYNPAGVLFVEFLFFCVFLHLRLLLSLQVLFV